VSTKSKQIVIYIITMNV